MAKDIKLNFGNDTADVNNFMSKDDALQHFRDLCTSYSQSLSDANGQLNDIYSYVNDFLHVFDEISDNYTYAIADINNINSYFEGISTEYEQLQNDFNLAYTYMNSAFDNYDLLIQALYMEIENDETSLAEVNTKVETLESYISDMIDNNNALCNIYTKTCDTFIADTEQVYSVTENNVTKEYIVTAKINYGEIESDETLTITNIDPETEEETTEEVNLYKPIVYVVMQYHNDNEDDTIILSNDMTVDGETENSVYTLSSDGKVEVADPARTVTVTKVTNEESDDNNANGNDNGSGNGANNGGTPGESGPSEQANH